MADRVIGSQLSVRENPHSLNADFLKIYFFYKSKPALSFVLMKTAFILCFIGAAISCADTWQHKYTFPEGQPSIAFNGTEFLYIQDFNNETKSMTVIKSSDLSTWTTYSNIPLPEDLFSMETNSFWGGTYISVLKIASLRNGCFILIVEKTTFPQMGNIYLYDTFSICSTDGISWTGLSMLPSFSYGNRPASLNIFNNTLFFLKSSGYPPGTVWAGQPTDHHLLKYDETCNEWTNLFQQSISMFDTVHLFQDDENSYIALSRSDNYGLSRTNFLFRLKNGIDWDAIPANQTDNCNGAVAHNNIIISKTKIYTPGRGWELAPHENLENITFNGQRLAGRQGEYLIFSDDFGKTIHQTHIPDLESATIFEAENQYVAVLNIRDYFGGGYSLNTSVYTLHSRPERVPVSSIEKLRSKDHKVEFSSVSNAVYQLESCTNLVNPVWNSYGLPVIGSGNDVAIDLPENLSAPIYFRVKALNH
ncbi:MAG: hypothetical protein WC959_09565 [Kiritimatiellales bacterium]